ncbi:MAG: F0F1 ATP synthase subunit delta, partial [Nitrospinae bacterium]|nr:F0F1 ATP synthase subunit delta [Nitrospinota bacterium]
MLENQVGKRYAEALSGNIEDNSQLGNALQGLEAFGEAMKTENELARFFEHPSISTEKKKTVVEELCNRLQIGDKVSSLLVMLNERGKIIFLDKIIEYF